MPKTTEERKSGLEQTKNYFIEVRKIRWGNKKENVQS
jgi:preprotein translocase subunit SecE